MIYTQLELADILYCLYTSEATTNSMFEEFNWTASATEGRYLLDVLLALLLGGILGYERERKEKPAGFRTHMIIAGASALLLILGQQIAVGTFIDLSDTALGVDPTRIIHATIVGVSFIGAGTVLKSREKTEIHYLTTAATLLMSSAIGICVGMHLYVMALGTTILTLLVNTLLRRFDK